MSGPLRGTWHVRRTTVAFLVTLVAVTAPSVAANSAEPETTGTHRFTLLDGTQFVDTIVGIDAEKGIRTKRRSELIPLNALRSVSPLKTPPVTSAEGDLRILLTGGGHLRAKSLSVGDEKLKIAWAFNAATSIPLESARGVLFDPKPDPLFDRAFAKPGADFDQFLIRVDGKPRTVRGLLESLDDKSARIIVNDRKATVDRKDLHGIVFAYVAPTNRRGGSAKVHLSDGAVIPARSIAAARAGDTVQLRLSERGEIKVPWNAVSRIEVFSDRLQFVSDLTPSAVAEQPIVTLKRPWKKDRSVTGTPLKVGGQTFAKGIGVHARSQLTFENNGRYELFTAVIGLDDSSGKKGDCNFVVLADGRELLRKRIKGTGKPEFIRVNITGAREVTLLVEPGRNLDIADHANWCDACFIRPAK